MAFTFLVRCHNHANLNWRSLDVMMNFWRIHLYSNYSLFEDEWISAQELPYLGTLHFHIVSEELFSQMVSLELQGQARVKFINDSGRNLISHWWGGGEEPGNDGHILPVWPDKTGAISHAFNPIPAWLTWSRHSGGEDLHQLTLYPMAVFQLPLPGCNHPFSGNFSCPIPTGQAVTVPVTPILFHSNHSAMRERRR